MLSASNLDIILDSRLQVENQDLICRVSCRDTGKTMVDGSLGEVLTTCEKIKWTLSEGEQVLM